VLYGVNLNLTVRSLADYHSGLVMDITISVAGNSSNVKVSGIYTAESDNFAGVAFFPGRKLDDPTIIWIFPIPESENFVGLHQALALEQISQLV
jgi:hypothetical protein